MTLDEAFGRYILEYASHLKSFEKTVNGHIDRLTAYFGGSTLLHEINNSELAAYVAYRRNCQVFDQVATDKRRSNRPLSNATINREVSTFRKLYNIANATWEVRVGNIDFPSHRLPEADCRVRWESHQKIEKIIQHAAPHLKHPIRFALFTGQRLSNIVNCRIEDLDLENRAIRFYVKSRKPGGKFHVVPMVNELHRMLVEEMAIKPGQHGFLFTYRGKPIKQFRRSWKTACEKARVEDFRFHDLRHTCASWMVQRGIPLELVKEVLGHASITTTMKYAHHRDTAKRDAMELVFKAQSRHTPQKERTTDAA
jgi:integrase